MPNTISKWYLHILNHWNIKFQRNGATRKSNPTQQYSTAPKVRCITYELLKQTRKKQEQETKGF